MQRIAMTWPGANLGRVGALRDQRWIDDVLGTRTGRAGQPACVAAGERGIHQASDRQDHSLRFLVHGVAEQAAERPRFRGEALEGLVPSPPIRTASGGWISPEPVELVDRLS